MNRYAARLWASLLTLSMLLPLAACGGNDAVATTMRLRHTAGTVAVSDGDGKEVPLLDNLGLYSGYGVDTRPESYAWIDLDDVKLAKMDQGSEIAIRKAGKALEIEVKSGALFFNVTQPLEDDETMDIRTSTMLVGIRGTCGWVEDRDGSSRVCLLEGRVECTAGDQTVQVNAGEMAEFTADGELKVTAMTVQDISVFVWDELTQDPGLSGAIYEASGLDVMDYPAISDSPAVPETDGGSEGDVVASGKAGENVTWSYYSDGIFTISGTGSMENYDYNSMPWYEYQEEIETVMIDAGVTSIGWYAFSYCYNLTKVTIPDSVTSIGESAFYGSSLTSVTIPNGVASIGEYAFCGCSELTSVTIPDSVTSIGRAVFDGCIKLTSVTIPNSVTSIETMVFNDCSSLTDMIIPDSVTSIGNWAFYGCSGLTSVTIPSSVTNIEDYAFYDCSGLTDVYYGGSAGQWGQIDIGENNDLLLNAAIHYQ